MFDQADSPMLFAIAAFATMAITMILAIHFATRKSKPKVKSDAETQRKQEFLRIMNDSALQSPEASHHEIHNKSE